MESKITSVVTGASGFVGSHLVDYLLSKGHKIKCILRETSSRRWLENKPVEVYTTGLFDKEGLKEVLKDADYLFHIAGVVKSKTEEGYFKGNVETTRNLLDALLEVNPSIKRVVISSSQTACGPSLDGKPVNEETPEHPITTYGRSKLEQEKAAKSYMDKLPITIVRLPAVYGERDTEIYQVFKTYKMGLMTLVGFDNKKLNLIHVADAVEGIYLAAVSEQSKGQIYFIASEKIYDWHEISEAIKKAFGRGALKIKIPHFLVYAVAAIAEFFALFSKKAATFNMEKARDFVQPAWTCDVSKAVKELGFRQKVSLEEGMKRTIGWYREMKWL
ncbi:NAD-dependent epimerase/dehydratase [Melioribacter roseus P3M-2]|uniref:NAD-dependent epimerase/dehydratase n=1 Tax=Melioribacter roseus (strain DSM 23840 / JCM 17771 / VKM B-2668 / P3M-2) TaxID=1191523 RepID=I6YZJ2_MELRP|nr:NAD(P)-dependent oxidoreductase [Melioribacter roseus]AFN75977.1 NAD-dependent epimerase/dehydratase [Melioribacter roseus P3M-2]